MLLTNGRVYNGRKFLKENTVEVKNGRITRIFTAKAGLKGAIDLKGRILAPGLIDIHTHAAASIDFLGIKSVKDVIKLKKAYLKQGVTSFLATTLYSTRDKARLRGIKWLQEVKGGARCLGVYLEGPFINPVKKGAIPLEYISQNSKVKSQKLIRKILGVYPGLKMMTVAPEMPGAENVIKYLRKKGVIVSFGHSNAGNKEARRGITCGARNVTHLFNGMRKWNDSDPSYKALLSDKRVMVELIADGKHVPPEILRMVYKRFGKDRIILISDATGGKGYYDAAREVGTNLELLELARRMKKFCGLSLEETLQMVTYNPAKLIGEPAGEIKVGFPAEMVVLNSGLDVLKIMAPGF